MEPSGCDGASVVSGRPIGLDLDPAAVEQADVVEALVAELPVRPGGEPVVVVAVQHDPGVVVDAGGAQQRLQLLAADEVPPDQIGQLALPVDAGRAGQMAGVVGIGVDVDLEEADLRVVEVLTGPIGAHEGSLSGGGGWICSGHRGVAGSFEPCSTGARAVAARADETGAGKSDRTGRSIAPSTNRINRPRIASGQGYRFGAEAHRPPLGLSTRWCRRRPARTVRSTATIVLARPNSEQEAM